MSAPGKATPVPKYSTFGVIADDGELLESLTTSASFEDVKLYYHDKNVVPVEDWTPEQRATYNEWCHVPRTVEEAIDQLRPR